MKSIKVLRVSKLMHFFGVSKIGDLFNNLMYKNNYIRAINYHSTPKENMAQFEEQLRYYSQNYTSVSEEDLKKFLKGNWNKPKPGLIISFDDGLETNYKYAKPLLDKYNFIGWFFIPGGLIGTGYCKEEHLTGKNTEKYMTWEQVKELSRNHVIGSHTLTHMRLKESIDSSVLSKEIKDSKTLIEDKLSLKIDTFCWVGGEIDSYSSKAAQIIKDSEYELSFLTNHYPILKNSNPLQLERTNIEADWPIHLVKFYMSALMDLKYKNKRALVRKKIN